MAKKNGNNGGLTEQQALAELGLSTPETAVQQPVQQPVEQSIPALQPKGQPAGLEQDFLSELGLTSPEAQEQTRGTGLPSPKSGAIPGVPTLEEQQQNRINETGVFGLKPGEYEGLTLEERRDFLSVKAANAETEEIKNAQEEEALRQQDIQAGLFIPPSESVGIQGIEQRIPTVSDKLNGELAKINSLINRNAEFKESVNTVIGKADLFFGSIDDFVDAKKEELITVFDEDDLIRREFEVQKKVDELKGNEAGMKAVLGEEEFDKRIKTLEDQRSEILFEVFDQENKDIASLKQRVIDENLTDDQISEIQRKIKLKEGLKKNVFEQDGVAFAENIKEALPTNTESKVKQLWDQVPNDVGSSKEKFDVFFLALMDEVNDDFSDFGWLDEDGAVDLPSGVNIRAHFGIENIGDVPTKGFLALTDEESEALDSYSTLLALRPAFLVNRPGGTFEESGFFDSFADTFGKAIKQESFSTGSKKGLQQEFSESIGDFGITKAEDLDPELIEALQEEISPDQLFGDDGFSPERAGEIVGTTAAIGAELAETILLTKGAGAGVKLTTKLPSVTKALTAAGETRNARVAKVALHNFYKNSPRLSKTLAASVKQGAQFELAGELFPRDEDELNFWSGFGGQFVAGGLGQGINKLVGTKQGQVILDKFTAIFGEKTVAAVNAVKNLGARGVGEVVEESTQELIQIWKATPSGQSFTDEFNKRFPDASSKEEFLVASFLMGSMFGSISTFEQARSDFKKAGGDTKVVDQVVQETLADQISGLNEVKKAVDKQESAPSPITETKGADTEFKVDDKFFSEEEFKKKLESEEFVQDVAEGKQAVTVQNIPENIRTDLESKGLLKKPLKDIKEGNITAKRKIEKDGTDNKSRKAGEVQVELLLDTEQAGKPVTNDGGTKKAVDEQLRQTKNKPKDRGGLVKETEEAAAATEPAAAKPVTENVVTDVKTDADVKAIPEENKVTIPATEGNQDVVMNVDPQVKQMFDLASQETLTETQQGQLDTLADQTGLTPEKVVSQINNIAEQNFSPDSKKIVQVNEIQPIQTTKEAKKAVSGKVKGEKSLKKAAKVQRKIATKLREGKLVKPSEGNLFSATPFTIAWDASLEAAALSFEAGAVVAEAVDSAIKSIKGSEWFNKLTPDQKKKAEKSLRENMNVQFNEQEKVSQTEEDSIEEEGNLEEEAKESRRQFAEQIEETKGISEEIKKGLSEDAKTFIPKKLRVTDAEADFIIKQKGLDESKAMVLNKKNELPDEVRVLMSQKLIRAYDQQARKATTKAEKTANFEKAVEIADFAAKFGTDLGRAIQAFSAWTNMSPEGVIFFANKTLKKNRKRQKTAKRSTISNVTRGVKNGRAKSARQAVKSTENTKAAKPTTTFGFTSKDIKDGKAAALAKMKRGGGLTSGGLSSDFLEGITEYGFFVFAEGVQSFSAWSKKMKSELGENATEAVLKDVWSNQKNETGKTLDEISQEPDLEQVVVDHFVGDPESDLAEKLQDIFNLDTSQANDLAKSLSEEFNKVSEKNINNAVKAQENGIKKKTQNAIDKIIADNISDPEAIANAILDSYGNQDVDPEFLESITGKAVAMQEIPAGRLKNNQAIEILSDIERKAGVKKSDILFSIWYASILSGWETQVLNFSANALNLALETFITSLERGFRNKSFKSFFNAYTGLFTGWENALSQSRAILKGEDPSKFSSKIESKNVLENLQDNIAFKGGNTNPLNWYKYVGRFMNATDTLFYYKFLDMRYDDLAGQIAKDEGLSGDKLNKRVSEILFNSEEDIEAARSQAETDLKNVEDLTGKKFTPNDVRLRAWEIIDQQREAANPEITTDADKFAAFGTFNYDPGGTLGYIAKGLSNASKRFPAFRMVVPFTRVVANVLNQQIDYTPYGFVRLKGGISGMFSKEKSLKPETREEANRRAIKASLGTVGMATVYLMAAAYDDEEDPFFDITGKGPSDFNKRAQLFNQGWKPFSVKIGDNWISYQFTNMGLGLSIIGNWRDADKYTNLSEKDITTRTAFAFGSTSSGVFEMSFLTGIAGLMKFLSENQTSSSSQLDRNVKAYEKTISNLGGQLVPNLVKQVGRVFDPTIYNSSTLTESLIKNIPVLNARILDARVNVLGEDVEKEGNRFFVTRTSDPIWKMFAEREVFIKGAGRSTTLDGIRMTDDQYVEYIKRSGQRIKSDIADQMDELRSLPKSELQEVLNEITQDHRSDVKYEMEDEFLEQQN